MPAPLRSAAADGAATTDGLPVWDLSDLYPAPDSAAVSADLTRSEREAQSFSATYAGTLAKLSGEALAEAIAAYERIEERLGRVMSYAQLLFAAQSSDPERGRFYQTITERVTAISSHLLFFTLELNRLDEAALAPKLAAPALAHFRPWLEDLRVFRPHQLSDELEKLLHEKEVTGHSAWSRLFDETIAALRVPLHGEALTVNAALEKLSDRDRGLREAAAAAIGEVFAANIRLFSFITNTLAKDKEIIDTWRRYPQPWRDRKSVV